MMSLLTTTTAMTTKMTTTDTQRADPSTSLQRPLYDPATGRFNVPRLQSEIFVRGWTVEEFVVGLECGRTSVYKVLAGKAVRNRIARAILEGLHRREPRPTLLGR